MLNRRTVLSRCGAAFAASALALLVSSTCHAQAAPSSDYTITLPDKRLLALPPFATEGLPKSLTFRVRLVTEEDGERQLIRVVSGSAPAKLPVLLDANLTSQDGAVRSCEIVSGTRIPGKPAYTAQLRAVRPGEGDDFALTIPAQNGRAATSGFVLHPLAAQLLIGRQYDFKQGGPQTFAVLQEWNGDALNPATDVATLILRADGAESLTLGQETVKARRLRYTLSVVGGGNEKTGTLFVGPKGELLQATPALWDVPFDGGKATGAAVQTGVETVLKTTGGETIKSRPSGDGYVVELYGKYDYPFVVATSDKAGRLVRVSERWNGRERVSTVAANEVRYRFSEGKVGLETVAAPDGRALFAPLWFATDLWEGEGSRWGRLAVGASQSAVWVPLWLGGDYARPMTITRLADARQSPDNEATYRRYGWKVDGGVEYDVYTDGARLVLLRGSDGLQIVRDDATRFAAAMAAKMAAEKTDKSRAPETSAPK